jgi:nitrile hydratase accessory protein
MNAAAHDECLREVDGIPRRNGELVFEEPWQARAFGLAMAVTSSDTVVPWEEFRQTLIAEIGAWEDVHGVDADGFSYYERWLGALERALVSRGLLSAAELAAAAEAIAEASAHEHDDEHQHA